MSIMIKLVYSSYIGFLLHQMFGHQDDRTFEFKYVQNGTSDITWNNSGVIIYHEL